MGQRINVVGCSGSGKSTLARAIADRLDLQFIELDSFQHQANWRQATTEEFLAHIAEAIEGDRWVIDGNYSMIRPTVWPRVETIIWLDYPFATCFSRIWRRTFRRWITRQELWNGNYEHLWWHFFSRKSLFLWVIQSHSKKRKQYEELFASQELKSKTLIRFRSPAEVRAWLASLESPDRAEPSAQSREPFTINT